MNSLRSVYKVSVRDEFPVDYKPVNVKFSKIRERVPYESLLAQDCGDGTCVMLSDVDLLFNQERLDRMSLQALQARLDEQVRAGNTGLSELRKNISDVDLHKFIKSRYIQSLSELQQWTNYLSQTEKGLVASIQASVGKDSVSVVNPTAPVGPASSASASAE